ncbi:MAG: cupin domain-containing protein [Candidatus Eremiobacteraeota bacterium]|nr:cupin domain-containing protein [Candidatus Eremiobacteraeota bacterium]MBV9055242.1 cupin domain-containing protein [Candidatus Eremiobacteraeota bacterium]
MTRNLHEVRDGFIVLENAEELQSAAMVLAPGEASGPLSNEHGDSEQVLFVAEGELEAQVGERKFQMRAGDSVIVPKNAPHRFINRSASRALTFNVYAPKAY